MKKLVVIVLFLISSLLGACSKSDYAMDIAPVFSLTYLPLKSLTDLGVEPYIYAGFIVEGRKSSMLPPTSTSCNRNDLMKLIFEANELVGIH
ncbi:hypothetical protein [Myroides odoratus]|uniref:hypothetical protein n=1 Tax=Myroides odoratus TaxID=256 RepID=UPI0039B09266